MCLSLPPEFSENWILKGRLDRAYFVERSNPDRSRSRFLEKLKAMGVRTVMLTGDRRGAAESVGRAIGD